mmetsp:Transcript_3332/g.10943  ORF Transcript_3332/g.10943 Transcript_3332/m.10943 type:complete len:204 (+) Transcript_3332:1392-2003(+)
MRGELDFGERCCGNERATGLPARTALPNCCQVKYCSSLASRRSRAKSNTSSRKDNACGVGRTSMKPVLGSGGLSISLLICTAQSAPRASRTTRSSGLRTNTMSPSHMSTSKPACRTARTTSNLLLEMRAKDAPPKSAKLPGSPPRSDSSTDPSTTAPMTPRLASPARGLNFSAHSVSWQTMTARGAWSPSAAAAHSQLLNMGR